MKHKSETSAAVPLLFWGVVLVGTIFLGGSLLLEERKLARSTWVVSPDTSTVQ
jgi:hypothetical protein